jgi:dihydrodipicolinate synthase/N-acetylneuraminate lyase
MVTPLRDHDKLDEAGLERLIEHLVAGGVSGLFILGTTGEAPSLSYRLRGELIERACRQVNGRVPVLVGITDTVFVESLRLAQHAAEQGAAAVVTSAPYYFPTGEPELLEHLEWLLPELPLPLFLYNMPSLTKVSFGPGLVRRLMEMEQVVGIKDSSGDMMYFHGLLGLARERPGWSVLMGTEGLLAEAVLMGGQGGVCGGANVAPRLYVDLYEAAATRDLSSVQLLQRQVQSLGKNLYTVGNHASSGLKGIKCALDLLGLCEGALARPFRSFNVRQRQVIAERMQSLGLLPRNLPEDLAGSGGESGLDARVCSGAGP